MLQLALDTWRTPHGNPVTAAYRPDTNDWNVLTSVLTNDEYGIPLVEGLAVDVGAHIGAWSLAMLIDNPSLRLVAIEPIPANVELLLANLARNGLGAGSNERAETERSSLDGALTDNRALVITAAASNGTGLVSIRHGATDTEAQAGHRYIGGATLQEEGEILAAQPISLSTIVSAFGPIRILKIDCEGCEWSFLHDLAIGHVEEIVGEWHHQPSGRTGQDIVDLLSETHAVTLTETHIIGEPWVTPDVGGFRAVRR